MTSPLFSICIPAYNASAFLSATLDSIRCQTLSDYEVVVIEDGSNDGTADIVHAFASRVENHVSYHRNPFNIGLPATRNVAIAESAGEYIALLDADDVWKPNHLTNLHSCIERWDADIACASSEVFDSASGSVLYYRHIPDGKIPNLPLRVFRGELVLQPSAAAFRRSMLQSTGNFCTTYPHANDREFWLRALRSGHSIYGSHEATCRYRKHEQAMSHSSGDLILDSARVLSSFNNWREIPYSTRLFHPSVQFLYSARILRSVDGSRFRMAIRLALGHFLRTLLRIRKP